MHPVTYCTNIHPGESWGEVFANLREFLPAVKRALRPHEPFPVGLRLPGLACHELEHEPERARAFGLWLQEQGLYVATINGFPYGAFHGRPVKQDVYLPDWRDPRRAQYTQALAELLALWLPQDMEGSISTVPVAFGKHLERNDLQQARGNVCAVLEALRRIHEEQGAFMRLSVEPEPGCFIETTSELVDWVHGLELSPKLRAHLACCYDCCHQALQFEQPRTSLQLLRENDIPIGHVQVSSALHLAGGDLASLERFCEPVYLHQAVARQGANLRRHDDLPQALRSCSDPDCLPTEEWRVHFHLPVFVAELPECGTTQGFLREVLPLFDAKTPLEVETYTWSVLPPELRQLDLTESIIREIAWVEQARQGRAAG